MNLELSLFQSVQPRSSFPTYVTESCSYSLKRLILLLLLILSFIVLNKSSYSEIAFIKSLSLNIISSLTSTLIPGTNPRSKSVLLQWSTVVVRAVAAVAASVANVRRRKGAVDPVATGVTGVAGAVDDADILRTGLLYYSKKLGFGGLL